MSKRRKVNYVNNRDFLTAMIAYKTKLQQAEAEGKELPQVPNYIGTCIFEIAHRLATKPNFSNYPFKEDMIGDGIENCLTYLNNFDPDKSNNPFAYFTTMIFNAFIRRIEKEKKQLYVKYKASTHAEIFQLISDKQDSDGDHMNEIKMSEHSQQYKDDFMEAFEQRQRDKKQK